MPGKGGAGLSFWGSTNLDIARNLCKQLDLHGDHMYIFSHESQQNRKTDTNINKGIMEINIYFHFNMWLYLRAMETKSHHHFIQFFLVGSKAETTSPRHINTRPRGYKTFFHAQLS